MPASVYKLLGIIAMPFASTPILGRPIDSVDSAKAVAAKLGKALDAVGVAVPHNQLLEVVARLCGAHHFNELTNRLSSGAPVKPLAKPSASAPVVSAALACGMRLPLLVELLAHPNIGTVEFLKSARSKPFTSAMNRIESDVLQAATAAALRQPLSTADQELLSGSRAAEPVFESWFRKEPLLSKAARHGLVASMHLTTRMLANAYYTGAGVWGLPSDRDTSVIFVRLLSAEELVFPDPIRIPLTSAELAEELRQTQDFGAPILLQQRGFECYTVNAESEALCRLLTLPANAEEVLAVFQPRCPWYLSSGKSTDKLRLRAVLLHWNDKGGLHLIEVKSQHDDPFTDIHWSGFHFVPHGRSPKYKRNSRAGTTSGAQLAQGPEGLAVLWQEIAAWVAGPDLSVNALGEERLCGFTVAEQLAAYLALRCKREGGGESSSLDALYFAEQLKAGVRDFFGIQVNAQRLLSDRQEPSRGFLKRFMAGLATQVPAGLKLIVPHTAVQPSPDTTGQSIH
jgi:hypothetical protein